jgi:hypothetical protein
VTAALVVAVVALLAAAAVVAWGVVDHRSRGGAAFQADLDRAAGRAGPVRFEDDGPFGVDTVGPGDPMWAVFEAVREHGAVGGTVVQTPDGVWRPVTIHAEDGYEFRDPSLPLPEEEEEEDR